MSFRWRVILLSAAAVATAIVIASAIVYLLVGAELRNRIDDELERDAAVTFDLPIFRRGALTPPEIGGAQRSGSGSGEQQRRGTRERHSGGDGERLVLPIGPLGGPIAYAQLVEGDGDVVTPSRTGAQLPATAEAIAVAAGEREAGFSEANVASGHVRVYTSQVAPGQAIQIARSLDETDLTLERLALILAAVSIGGIFLGGGFGVLISRAALSPVGRLSRAASEVATTRDLSRRIDPAGGHELAELARSFNRMLTALEGSLDSQRQLVADASHELRTPLASLRTNIEVLAHSETMDPGSRERLLADVIAQLDELTVLVGDLVDLARDTELDQPVEAIRLDRLAEDTVEAALLRRPGARIDLASEPCVVRGSEQGLARAISNLLDNAIKWSPEGAPVEVRVSAAGEVEVRDRGPGIPPDDLPRVFDRFYRSTAARRMPGSGLGLAIVRRVAESHGGSAEASSPPDGGTLIRLRIPVAPAAGSREREPVLT
ncbi:MAG TPA: HAMP domain-containing sensor histidine kinase [Solirubrobacterales bacterium]|nr:HAMP domain-containing sensor histidine kinase [Solirubrobacterales bacterium]